MSTPWNCSYGHFFEKSIHRFHQLLKGGSGSKKVKNHLCRLNPSICRQWNWRRTWKQKRISSSSPLQDISEPSPWQPICFCTKLIKIPNQNMDPHKQTDVLTKWRFRPGGWSVQNRTSGNIFEDFVKLHRMGPLATKSPQGFLRWNMKSGSDQILAKPKQRWCSAPNVVL